MSNELTQFYHLDPISQLSDKNHNMLIKKRRVLVGRIQACDVVIPCKDVTAIHAVIEVGENGFTVYDMNSTNGTFVNGKKIVAERFGLNDKIRFSVHEFVFKKAKIEDLPPRLDAVPSSLPPQIENIDSTQVILSPAPRPVLPEISKSKLSPAKDASRPTPPVAPAPSVISSQEVKEAIPRVEYPLAKDPNAEFSEYIFEDIENLYPIFNYQSSTDAVEVIILFQDSIFSVDYLPLKKNGTYHLVGNSTTSSEEIGYSYLGKNNRVPFIKMIGDETFVEHLTGYEVLSVNNPEKVNTGSTTCLDRDNIVRFHKGDLDIFVRKTDSPPKVAHAPILRRDQGFKKYLFLVFLIMGLLLAAMSYITVNKEIEKEKAPERIATILHKRKIVVSKYKAIAKTKDKPKKVAQKSPKRITEPKKPPAKVKTPPKPPRPKPKPVQKKKSLSPKKLNKPIRVKKPPAPKKRVRPKRAKPNKGPQNLQKKRVTPKRKNTRPGPSKASNLKTNKVSKSKGRIDTYKSFDFKSSVSSLLAKGGSIKKVNVKTASESSVGHSAVVGGGRSSGATARRAKVSHNIGSLAGAASGRLDSGKGLEGISSKNTTYAAGIPYKTVVLGGMDPDIIRRILKEHLPQFRYCYQKELDRSKKAFSGVVKLSFIIGNSGHVSKAGVSSKSPLPRSVTSCVVNVLKGIRFPAPPGGGTVEVRQPINFYPNIK